MGALPSVTNRPGNLKPLVTVAYSNPRKRVSNLVQENLFGFILGARFAQVSGEGYSPVAMTALAKPSLGVIPGERPVMQRMHSEQCACAFLNPVFGCHLRRVTNMFEKAGNSSTQWL